MANLYEQTLIGQSMEIIKPALQITITKGDMNIILAEAMGDEAAGAAIKRILNPFLVGAFPQHPTFTNVTLGDTAEDGSTIVNLKVPRVVAEASNVDRDAEEEDEIIEESGEMNPQDDAEA